MVLTLKFSNSMIKFVFHYKFNEMFAFVRLENVLIFIFTLAFLMSNKYYKYQTLTKLKCKIFTF